MEKPYINVGIITGKEISFSLNGKYVTRNGDAQTGILKASMATNGKILLGLEEMESIENPWENVISRKKEYHGIRIPGHKKSTRVYQNLIPELERQWKQVVNLCESAKIFERSVKEAWND